jgi:nucleotide-binding universal stress UspA family protein
MERRLVVGVDGSDGAAYALEWVIPVARDLDAEVIVVHAMERPLFPAGGLRAFPTSPAWEDAWREWRKEVEETFVRDWCAPIRESGVPYRAELLEGDPAQTLLEVADREAADMIVVGSRGRGGIAKLMLGSVSHALTNQSGRPIVVIPPPS